MVGYEVGVSNLKELYQVMGTSLLFLRDRHSFIETEPIDLKQPSLNVQSTADQEGLHVTQ